LKRGDEIYRIEKSCVDNKLKSLRGNFDPNLGIRYVKDEMLNKHVQTVGPIYIPLHLMYVHVQDGI
jgi:hypothetical protein